MLHCLLAAASAAALLLTSQDGCLDLDLQVALDNDKLSDIVVKLSGNLLLLNLLATASTSTFLLWLSLDHGLWSTVAWVACAALAWITVTWVA